MKIQTMNPATEDVLHVYDCLDEHVIDKKIEEGHAAYLAWKEQSFSIRKKLMQYLAQLLEQKKEEFAYLMALEMGKPVSSGVSEIEKCARLCRFYAEHAEEYLTPKFIQTEMKTTKVCYRPKGIVLGIMPWNFPVWQVMRFAVPTLMAGNAAILKHAPITTGTGNKIEELFLEAGFPNALFQHLIVDNTGAASIIKHPLVSAVTLTGSERAGSIVASEAGKYLKKSVLDLGGSDPYVVLEDADIEHAAQCIVSSRLNNSGQVCIAAKRIIAMHSIKDALTKAIINAISSYKMGNPLDPQVTLGPLARSDLRDTLQEQVEKSLKQGAKLLLGGIIPDGTGFYYPPTVLTDVTPGMTAFDEELFGPVVSMSFVADEEEAIAYANQNKYGLGAAVFTRDLKKGEYLATYKIEAGCCFVNSAVFSDPRLPFGGIKHSGYGRELSQEGILEFVNIKTVAVGGAQ